MDHEWMVERKSNWDMGSSTDWQVCSLATPNTRVKPENKWELTRNDGDTNYQYVMCQYVYVYLSADPGQRKWERAKE